MSGESSTAPSSAHHSEEDAAKINSEPATSDSSNSPHQISFSSYQLFVFVACYVSYAMMLYNRKVFIYTLPHILIERYFNSYEVGMIQGAQTCMYTLSRFFSGWGSDYYSPQYMLTGALFLTGFVMLAFSDQEDWPNIMLLTAANGAAQGMGWPAVSKMIRAWYPPTQFGFWFALLATAANLVGTIGPGIATALAVTYGWRMALQVPAISSVLLSAIIPFCSWDKPSDVDYEDEITMFGVADDHWSDLAGSDFMFLLTSVSCFLYMAKTCCQEWGQMFLVQERGLSSNMASTHLVAMEVGGLVGSIVLGALTDHMIRRGYYFGTGKSPRMSIVQLCVAGACLFLNLFMFTVNLESSKSYMWILGFLMGFCMYGSLSLLGTIAIEVAPIQMTGTAHGIVGLAGNIGAILAGVPMGYVASLWELFGVFMLANILGFVAFIILVIGKDISASYKQPVSGVKRISRLSKASTVTGVPGRAMSTVYR